MAGMVTAADKAWMAANFGDVVADWGEVGTVRRLVRDGNGQSTAAAAHLTGVKVYIEGARAEIALAMEMPVGDIFIGITTLYTVPTQMQTGDLLVVASGTYEIVGISLYPSHLELVLTRYIPKV
jgi:hypothetical protein